MNWLSPKTRIAASSRDHVNSRLKMLTEREIQDGTHQAIQIAEFAIGRDANHDCFSRRIACDNGLSESILARPKCVSQFAIDHDDFAAVLAISGIEHTA